MHRNRIFCLHWKKIFRLATQLPRPTEESPLVTPHSIKLDLKRRYWHVSTPTELVVAGVLLRVCSLPSNVRWPDVVSVARAPSPILYKYRLVAIEPDLRRPTIEPSDSSSCAALLVFHSSLLMLYGWIPSLGAAARSWNKWSTASASELRVIIDHLWYGRSRRWNKTSSLSSYISILQNTCALNLSLLY